MASAHCTMCGPKKSCGNHHVYVVELRPEVLRMNKYCKDDREHLPDDSELFYVGESEHRPECRYYNQHAPKKSRRKRQLTFDCMCDTGQVKKVKFTTFNSASVYVNKHRRRLRPDLYRHLNPIRGGKQAARQAEEALARTLKQQGHLAHHN